jgi:hypothetical protein
MTRIVFSPAYLHTDRSEERCRKVQVGAGGSIPKEAETISCEIARDVAHFSYTDIGHWIRPGRRGR